MEIQSRIEELKTFQKHLLDFLSKKEQSEESYQNLSKLLSCHDFNNNKKELMPFISLILNVFRNHQRSESFNDKIFQVFTLFLDNLKQKNNYSNLTLFNIFKNDKRILLYLIEQGVLTIDEEIINLIHKGKFNNYDYFNYLVENKNEAKSQIGENDNYICELIRNDSIDEFVTYVNQKNIDVKCYSIPSSIFETNSFLLKNKNPTLIEYAAFFGSIRIFNYLKLNGSQLTSSLWFYSIHSNNAELIQILEDSKIEVSDSFYNKCLKEAIKCHHNEIAEYIQSKFIKDQEDPTLFALKYYNYEFYPPNFDGPNQNIFIYAIKYGHFYIVEHILSLKKFDVNQIIECPYKNKEFNEEEEKINKSKNKNKNKLYPDWTRWDEISKESRENDRIRKRKYWKSRYNKEEISPLHLAVENECIDIVELLLNEPKIDVNQKMIRYYDVKDDGWHEKLDEKREEKTALHIAVEKNNLEIVKLLCNNQKIDINIKTIDCYPSDDNTRERKTPIHIAIENGETEIVDFLSHLPNIKINLKSNYERWWNGGKEEYEEKSPLNLAAEIGNYKICQILLSNPKIDVNEELIEFYTTANLSYLHKRKETSFIIAISKGYYDIVKLLLDNDQNDIKALAIKEYRYYFYERKKQFKTPLFLAIENNDYKIVELLLSSEKIEIKQGLMNIGGGSNLRGKSPIDNYNPEKRNDINKPIRPNSRRGLDYLDKRKDNHDMNGVFSDYKKELNDERYLNVTEEEDTDDDFDFRYSIYSKISPLDIANKIGNSEIEYIIEIASNDPKYSEHEDGDDDDY